MSATRPHERRRHPRVLVDVPIRLSTIDPEIDPWSGRPFFRSCEEAVADVSRGGARVRSTEPLGAGRRLLLEIELPDGRAFDAIARVAWSRLDPRDSGGYGFGLEFLGGSPDQSARLDAMLRTPRAPQSAS